MTAADRLGAAGLDAPGNDADAVPDEWDDAPYVCPGCYAIGDEPHAGYCVDAEIERDSEEERDRGGDDACDVCGASPCDCWDGAA